MSRADPEYRHWLARIVEDHRSQANRGTSETLLLASYQLFELGELFASALLKSAVEGKAPVRRRRTTDSRHDFPRYPNLVVGLEVTRPDHVWIADITYVRLREEFVYLAVVMDVFTHRVRGWVLGRGLD